MGIVRKVYRREPLTWGKWVDGRLSFFSWREGGAKANFAISLRRGIPRGIYVAIPVFGRWFRFHAGKLTV